MTRAGNAFPVLARLVVIGPGSSGAAQDVALERAQVLALDAHSAPPLVHPADGFAADGNLRPLYFAGLPYRGQPTRVFAWYGAPSDRAGKWPAIVLVHGGGGTAFKEWVRKWNEHGFAAISIAVEGQTDQHQGAVLIHTADSGFTGRRRWLTVPAQVDADGVRVRVSAPLPSGTRGFFFNLEASGPTASSEFTETGSLNPPAGPG